MLQYLDQCILFIKNDFNGFTHQMKNKQAKLASIAVALSCIWLSMLMPLISWMIIIVIEINGAIDRLSYGCQ